jgi:hypothetical protein
MNPTKTIRRILNVIFHVLAKTKKALRPAPVVKVKHVVGSRKTKFKRWNLNFYNSLKCVPDIEEIVSMKAKHICNVVAAYKAYQRLFGTPKQHMQDSNVVVWAPNKRMNIFLKHLTKWQVYENAPVEPFVYFGVNPPRSELEYLQGLFAREWENQTTVEAAVIVGTDPAFLKRTVPSLHSKIIYWDQGILGPNKHVTVS